MATRASIADIQRLRLAAQGIQTGVASEPAGVVRHLLAMQAQDFGSACWAVGLRAPNSTQTEVLAAMANGEIVRSWPMRGTLHLVAAEDLGWMLQIASARILAAMVTRRRQLELDERTIEHARDTAIAALSGGRALSRDDFLKKLEAAGISTTGQRGYHMIVHLALTGLLCWGPPGRTQQSLVLLDEWVTAPRRLERDEALREFLVRYLSGHGPATLKDFVWWSKITVAEAKEALALARGELEELVVGDTGYWMMRETADRLPPIVSRAEKEAVHILPGFDEYLLGFQDRSPILDPEHAPLVVPGNNGIFQPTIVASGRIIGLWHRSSGGPRSVTVAPEPFDSLTAWQERGFARAARRYGRFLRSPVSVV